MKWTGCNHACDPQADGARRDGAWHYSDCPVWDYLGVDPAAVHARDCRECREGCKCGGA